MMKKKKDKSTALPEKEKEKKETVKEELPEDNRFDFGGLPHRDLKKNLGCG